MPTLALDTNAAVKKLEQGGLTRAQADAVAEVIQSIDTSALATKQDLDLALSKQTTKIVTWVSGYSHRTRRRHRGAHREPPATTQLTRLLFVTVRIIHAFQEL
jgi:hypothetical protein